MRHTSRRSIPGDGGQKSASQALAQFLVAVAGEEFPQILSGQSLLKIALQKTLNRVRNFTRQTPVADWTSNRLMQTDCTADAEVVGILEPSSDFNFLAFNPNVCDPVLPAAVRAAGDVSLRCCSNPGNFSSSSSTSQRAKLLVSVIANLQNSVPLQAMAPRQNAEAPTRNPAASNPRASVSTLRFGALTMSRFCMFVVRSSPPANSSARSAALRICSAEILPRSTAAPTYEYPGCFCG